MMFDAMPLPIPFLYCVFHIWHFVFASHIGGVVSLDSGIGSNSWQDSIFWRVRILVSRIFFFLLLAAITVTIFSRASSVIFMYA